MSWMWFTRLAWAAGALAWFFWISIEDQNLGPVFVVSAILCSAAGLSFGRRPRRRPLGTLVIGLVAGAAIPLMAVVLMSLKVSLHSHPEPDFAPADIQAALISIPLWSLAGLMAGAASLMLRMGGGRG